MTINGLTLPPSFVGAIRQGKLRRSIGSWPLLIDIDAYGNHLETELGEVYEHEETILKARLDLPAYFEPDGYYGVEDDREKGPGAIPDITEFSKIICFGMSGDEAPFCFDFRDGPSNPSVIWWDDIYWRRVAPDFEAFMNLFDLTQAAA